MWKIPKRIILTPIIPVPFHPSKSNFLFFFLFFWGGEGGWRFFFDIISYSQGKVEYKARSILAALYSMRDIDLLSSRSRRLGAGTCVNAKARTRGGTLGRNLSITTVRRSYVVVGCGNMFLLHLLRVNVGGGCF